MNTEELEKLKYPTGKFSWDKNNDPDVIKKRIEIIEQTPAKFRKAVAGLTEEQLNTPYRPEGWTLRQVIHHTPDSHLNAYIRTKLILTEDQPTVKPYSEKLWAETADYDLVPVSNAVNLLEAVHDKWVPLLKSLQPSDFERTFLHPEYPGKVFPLGWIIALYAWHGPHHTAHITTMRERLGW